MYKELHEDMVAYASINKTGEPRLQATPPFNDGAALSETHDTDTSRMTLFVTRRFNQKQIHIPIHEWRTPMMIYIYIYIIYI